MRKSFSVDISVIVLNASGQCDEFFRGTGIHAMAVDLHWCVAL